LHMAQLMPLALTVSCFSKIQIGFTFLVPAHLGSPGQKGVKRLCVCACVSRYIVSDSVSKKNIVHDQRFGGDKPPMPPGNYAYGHSQHFQMLKIETGRFSIGLKMAVADVLRDQNKHTCEEWIEIIELLEPRSLSTK